MTKIVMIDLTSITLVQKGKYSNSKLLKGGMRKGGKSIWLHENLQEV